MITIPPHDVTRHDCILGDSKEVAEGTLRACEICGKWWYAVVEYKYWVEYEWKPVRWYHFSKLERIRNYIEDRIPLP